MNAFTTCEEYLLLVITSSVMLEDFDLLERLLHAAGLDHESINDLPVSDNFKGNFWRLVALIQFRKGDLTQIYAKLAQAKSYFEEEDSHWGLGLTYYLQARIKPTIKSCGKALEYFCKIDHFRGIFVVLQMVAELKNTELSKERLYQDYHKFKQLFLLQCQQGHSHDTPNGQLLRNIVCGDPHENKFDSAKSLEMEIVIDVDQDRKKVKQSVKKKGRPVVPILLNPFSIGDRLLPKGMKTGDELRGEFDMLDRL